MNRSRVLAVVRVLVVLGGLPVSLIAPSIARADPFVAVVTTSGTGGGITVNAGCSEDAESAGAGVPISPSNTPVFFQGNAGVSSVPTPVAGAFPTTSVTCEVIPTGGPTYPAAASTEGFATATMVSQANFDWTRTPFQVCVSGFYTDGVTTITAPRTCQSFG